MTTLSKNDLKIEIFDADDSRAEAAIHSVLTHENQNVPTSRDEVDGFLDAVAIQGLKLWPIAQAKRHRRVVTSAVTILSPGKTGLIMLAASDRHESDRLAAIATLRRLCDEAWQSDVSLMQVLLQPHDPISQVLADSGFSFLAELVYLQRSADQFPNPNQSTPVLDYVTFSPSTEAHFLTTLERTYTDSLDCPGMSGLRKIRDVLIGHRHTGVFQKHLWMLAKSGDKWVGILLLTEIPGRACLEIAYVGVDPDARGCGIGDALVRKAIEVAWEEEKSHVTLAVDHTNTFACELYARWQFTELARRRAWILPRPS